MKKIHLSLLILCFGIFFTKINAATVTFQVDMSLQTVSPNGVHLAGSFQNWDPAATAMTSTGNGIYSVTLTVPNGPIEYKFINGNAWTGSENVPGACNQNGNRFATISGNLTLPLICFGQCIACPSATYTITFQVDMKQQTVSPLGVHIAGVFQNWDPAATLMTDLGNGIWTKTVSGLFGTVEYKFINGNDWPQAETVPAACASGFNRYVDALNDMTLSPVCFSDCAACPAGSPITVNQTAITNVSCNGGNNGAVTVAVTGASGCTSTYLWSNGQTAANATGLAAGSYTVTATCGTQTATYTASITQPTALLFATTATQNASCTAQGSASVTTSGGTGTVSYLWSGGQTTASINVPAGTYSVTATDANACKKSTSLTVGSTSALPTAQISNTNPSINCAQSTVTLMATGTSPSGGAVTYSWSGPGVVSGATTANAVVNKAGAYTVTVSDAGGCSTTKSVTVVEDKAAPTVSIQGNSSICTNDSTILTTNTTFSTYAWSTGSTANNIKVKTLGTYSVTVTGSNGCTGTATKAITAAPLPVVNVPTDTLTCTKNSTVLNVTTTSTLTSTLWTGPNNYTSNVLKPTISQVGNYTLVATNSQGCTQSFSTTIYQSSNTPVVNITGVAAICQGASTTLTATPNLGTYLWSNGNTTNTITVSQTGTYSLTVTNSQGCKISAASSVTAAPNPVVTAANVKVCEGQTAELKATSTGSGITYSWSNNSSFSANTQNVAIPNVKANNSGDYYVTAKSAAGCIGKDTLTLSIAAGPQVNAPDVKACEGQTAELKATTNSTSSVLYTWTNAAGFLGNTQNISIANATPTNSGLYFVSAKNANGCTGRDTLSLSISPKINTIFSSTIDCDNNATILFSATGGTQPLTNAWNTGLLNTNTAQIKTPATVTVTVTDSYGCIAVSNDYKVEPNAPFSVSGNVTPFNDTNAGAINLTTVNGKAPFTYEWSNGEKTKDIIITKLGQYCVTVTDANACKTSNCFDAKSNVGTDDSILANAIHIFPNPINDVINIKTEGNLTITSLQLLDYSGKILDTFKGNTLQINTNHLPSGIYLLKCITNDGLAIKKIVKN